MGEERVEIFLFFFSFVSGFESFWFYFFVSKYRVSLLKVVHDDSIFFFFYIPFGVGILILLFCRRRNMFIAAIFVAILCGKSGGLVRVCGKFWSMKCYDCCSFRFDWFNRLWDYQRNFLQLESSDMRITHVTLKSMLYQTHFHAVDFNIFCSIEENIHNKKYM